MKQIRKVLLILITLTCGYVVYKYYNFNKYVNIYNDESATLAERIEYYSISRLDNISNNKKDFNKMLDWLKNIDGIQNILDYGINFKYDSSNQSLSIYSFGIDKADDNLRKPSYSTSDIEHTIFGENDVIDNWSFWDIFDTKGRDVLLLKTFIGEDYLCVNYVNSDLFSGKKLLIPFASSYVFYQDNDKVSGQLEKELKEKIRPYKHLVNPTIPELNDSTKIFFIRFKDGNFHNACSDDIDLDIFDLKLKEFLINNKIDYAIIPILTNDNKNNVQN